MIKGETAKFVTKYPWEPTSRCKDDFECCCAGMIKGETEGDEATRAVVEAAKAVAGGKLFSYIVNKCFSSEHCEH